jgi:hypothetical protein
MVVFELFNLSYCKLSSSLYERAIFTSQCTHLCNVAIAVVAMATCVYDSFHTISGELGLISLDSVWCSLRFTVSTLVALRERPFNLKGGFMVFF